MAISFYTGTPGSGKSYHLSLDIYKALSKGKTVFANFNVNYKLVKPAKKNISIGNFFYIKTDFWRENSIREINFDSKGEPKRTRDGKIQTLECNDFISYINGLINYARNFHKFKINHDGEREYLEHQTLLVFDECHRIWNPREWNRKDRLAWINFLSEHRHLGFDIIMTSQEDKKVDKQIRGLLEDEFLHRKFFNFVKNENISFLLRSIFGEWFIVIKKKYGMSKKNSKMHAFYLRGKKKYYDFYNTSTLFEDYGEFVGCYSSALEHEKNIRNDYWNDLTLELFSHAKSDSDD